MEKHMPIRSSALLAVLMSAATATAQEHTWFDAPLMRDSDLAMQNLVDLDLDGDVDVLAFEFVATTRELTTYRPLYNNGQGVFTQGPVVALPPGSGGPRIADINGDGLPDLVTTVNTGGLIGQSFSTIYVHAGIAGGTFAVPIAHPLPSLLMDLAVGDANGDGRDDLLVQIKTPNVPTIDSQWLFGGAGHSLTAGPQFYLPFRPLPGVFGVTTYETLVADCDGDQRDDIAVAVRNNPTDRLEVFFSSPGGVTVGPLLQLNALSYATDWLTSMDTDQDGDRDIVLGSTNGTDSAVTIYSNLGGGSWTHGVMTLLGGSYAGPMVAGDLDGDGRTDLCSVRSVGVSTTHHLHWLRSTGPDTFAFAGTLDIPGVTAGAFALAGCADLDGDGRDDLVDAQTIIFGEGAFAIDASEPGRWLTDWDGDGDIDSLVHYEVLRNNGTGQLTEETIPFSFLAQKFYVTPQQLLGDLDGDGLLDMTFGVLTLGGGGVQDTRRMRQLGNGVFIDAGLAAPAGTSPFSTREQTLLQDFDGDGDLDILSFHEVWLNNGSSFFTPSGIVFGPTSALEQGDVDGDGDLDVLCTDLSHRSLLLAKRTGPTAFTTTTLFVGGNHFISAPFARVLADLDDDGDLDAAGVRSSTSATGIVHELIICENVGGVLTQALILPYGGPIAAGDIDGDGKTDLCASLDEELVVLRRTGPGLAYAAPARFACPPVRKLVDFDQDGDLDGWGDALLDGARFVAPDAGMRRQYGQGSAGTGARRPLLSVTGTIRPGSTPAIRLRHAPGGTLAFLMVANAPADGPSAVLPGVHDYVALPSLILTYPTSGAVGQPGSGSLDIPVPIPPSAAGANLFFEFLVLDAAVPGLLTYSNGCEFLVGQ